MSKSISFKTLLGLVSLLAVLSAVNTFIPQGSTLPVQDFPLSKPVFAVAITFVVFIIYGLLGIIGMKLSRKVGFADIWNENVSNRKRFLIPAFIGGLLGIALIIIDQIFSRFNDVGNFPHPPFPTSLIASISAGIGEELIFRLFFISFWVWMISKVFLKDRWPNGVFWVVGILSSIAFAIGHLPSVMVLFNFSSMGQIPLIIIIELFLMNGLVGLFCAYYFRKYGYLATVGIHFWTDIVWHVIWGLV